MIELRPATQEVQHKYLTGDTSSFASSEVLKRYARSPLQGIQDLGSWGWRSLPFSANSVVGSVVFAPLFALGKAVDLARTLKARLQGEAPIQRVSLPDFKASFPLATPQQCASRIGHLAAMQYAYGADRNDNIDLSATAKLAQLQASLRAEQARLKSLIDSYHDNPKSFLKTVIDNKKFDIERLKLQIGRLQEIGKTASWELQPLCREVNPRDLGNDEAGKIDQALPTDLREMMANNDGFFIDPNTGLRAALLLDRTTGPNEKPRVFLSFSGTGEPHKVGLNRDEFDGALMRVIFEEEQNQSNYAQMAGVVPPSVKQAIALGQVIREALGNRYEVVSVGHSRGGMLAQAEALANDGTAVCANSEPMGVGVRNLVGVHRFKSTAGHQVEQLSFKGDWLTDQRALNTLAVGFENLTGIAVPRNAGRGLKIPVPEGTRHVHGNFFNLGLWYGAGGNDFELPDDPIETRVESRQNDQDLEIRIGSPENPGLMNGPLEKNTL